MRTFEKVAIFLGFLVIVVAVVSIRLTLDEEQVPDASRPAERVRAAAQGGGPRPGDRSQVLRPTKLGIRSGDERSTPRPLEVQDTVLARVNGMPITERQVFGPRGLSDQVMEGAEGDYPRKMLDAAIDQELLRQYGVEQGLDQTVEYRETMKQFEKMAERMKVNRLASFYEERNEELRSMKDSLKATTEEVDEYYDEYRQRYKRLGEKKAKQIIARMLSMQKYNQGYKAWLGGVMESVPVTVDGQEIPLEVLQDAINGLFPGPREADAGTGGKSPGRSLAEYVRTAVGVTDDSEESRERIMKAEIVIGDNVVALGELFPGRRGPVPGRGNASSSIPIDQILHGPMLIAYVKGYVVAEEARQDGVHETEEFKAHIAESQTIPGSRGGEVLPRLVMEKEGLFSPGELEKEVTDEEIDAHIEANPGRYRRIMDRSPERARDIARRRIAYEKLREKKQRFMADLRARATIEIVDERFR